MANLVGIYNENDFYSHHYLTSVFESDIRGVMDQWTSQESEAREFEKKERALGREPQQGFRSPYSKLASYAGSYFKQLNEHSRERDISKRLLQQRRRWLSILSPLGYEFSSSSIELDSGLRLPVLANYQQNDQAFLWVVEAHDKFDDDSQDPLALSILKEQLDKVVTQETERLKKHSALMKPSWQDVISKHILTDENPPRWILLLGNRQALLIDRTKWAQNRLLRFDFEEILGRKETNVLKACAALLHKDSVMPESGQPLLDNLDENSHKHAFSVSEDLKYALRESIELLGNEATQFLIAQGKANFTGERAIQPEELSRECLRYMYRLLFLFYIEARPELEYAPLDSMTYLKGYSLETLRDLELVPLYSEADKQGHYIHDSLNLLFRLIHKGYPKKDDDISQIDFTTEKLDTFSVTKLDSHLFDPKRTPTLNKVVFTNLTMQRILNLMSLSKEKSGKSRRGRISYSQLGINQLGAVYEALLSYRGFFAQETLYEVKKKGDKYSELETGYFVTSEQFNEYDEEEKVTQTIYEGGEKKTRYKKFEKGSFIYRMAGRDREKSASYYTPEVLTKSLVKYALIELFKEKIEPLKTAKAKANAIIKLTVCEPAMGSAAFLNEAINQLSEHYLFYKQQAEKKRIPQDEYTRELQRVKMYIADNNVFGVDLNSVAVELAEVSLWLNAISSEAFVPWFGYQLFNGNSLIGARRQIFPSHQLSFKNKNTPSWLNQAPLRIEPGKTREKHQVYHFLLGDNGMANYTDKVVKGLKPDEIKIINDWRKEFNAPWSDEDKSALQRISKKIDDLWTKHTKSRAAQRQITTDALPLWPDKANAMSSIDMATKDKLLEKAMTDGASSYQRLKMVMDYWCALWFWPIDQAEELPERWEYLSDVETLLDGYIQTTSQEDAEVNSNSGFIDDMFDNDENDKTEFFSKKGTLKKDVVFSVLPRVKIADSLATRYKYFHWELEFTDIFERNSGFDLILGNPPWLQLGWEEKGIISDFDPKVSIKTTSASDVNQIRKDLFDSYKKLSKSYFSEYIETAGSINFVGATSNYSLASGSKQNLYKLFCIKGLELLQNNGVSGLIFEDSVYSDSSSLKLREKLQTHQKFRFVFEKSMSLFNVKGNNKTNFSVNVYSKNFVQLDFKVINGLTHPSEIDNALSTDLGRVLRINSKSIECGVIDGIGGVVPSIRFNGTLTSLAKIKSYHDKLKNYANQYFLTTFLNETNSQKSGEITRHTGFVDRLDNFVVSGPQFGIGNLFSKTPKRICSHNSHYDPIELTDFDLQYLPRTNYRPSIGNSEFYNNAPVSSLGKNVMDDYRFLTRELVDLSTERTLVSTIIPPGVSHINSCVSILFQNRELLLGYSAMAMSIISDFYIKSLGSKHLNQSILSLLFFPNEKFRSALVIRCLHLVCISESYLDLCNSLKVTEPLITVSKKVQGCTNYEYFIPKYAIKSDYSRRWLLIEIDVLSAMNFELSLNELLAIYEDKFSKLNDNESDTWYDLLGRIIFTSSKGLTGIGLDRKYNKKNDFQIGVRNGVFVENSDQINKVKAGTEDNPWNEVNGQLGWEDIRDLKSGIVTKTYMDDTVPDGPVERTMEYHAPFDRCDREEDYKTVWAEFERRFGTNKEC